MQITNKINIFLKKRKIDNNGYEITTLYINKLICIVSLRKILYSLQRGSNHGPLALGASIIPRDHRAVQKIS